MFIPALMQALKRHFRHLVRLETSTMDLHSATVCQFLILFCLGAALSVKIRVLDVPQVAQAGHTVPLTCDYDLERQRLYQIKWYKGTHEFYRYSPMDRERVKLFLVENLHVDVQKSDDRTVVLKDLHVDMTGKYTCEVSTEGIFETVQGDAEMTVVALPRGGPHIQGVPNHEVNIGEELLINCTSLKSKPAAKLEFFLNNNKVSGAKDLAVVHAWTSNGTSFQVSGRRAISLRQFLITNEEDKPQTESSILSMQFHIRKHHVRQGRILIRCEATILNAYRGEKTKEIFVRTHQAANLSNNKYSGLGHAMHSLGGLFYSGMVWALFVL
eukprot:maker-scaffold497_size155254-snap-gene-0.10 protein:Tk01102 transcript:maker-scaffold497_size155254-snap-gene-0.10-mRNA-1 annotation:"PREDICTED: uncharacterized protein LOC102680362 isoform X2"